MSFFLAPALLLGGLFAGVPLVIHLLNKSRFKVEAWGAMMFLHSAIQVRAQRLRVQELLLLLLRMGFFALLALALARPVIRGTFSGESGGAVTHLLIFDGSYSMRQGGADSAFTRAKQAALAIVDGMRQDDNMLLLWGGSRPELIFPKPVFDKDFLRGRIQALEAGSERLDVPRALEQSFFALEGSTLPRQRIYLLTDAQRQGWSLTSEGIWNRLKAHLETLKVRPAFYVLNTAPPRRSVNRSVRSLTPRSPVVDIYRQAKFIAEIEVQGDQDGQARVEFLVDGQLAGERQVLLKPGANSVDFDASFSTPGSHYVSAAVEEDELPIDDSRTTALDVLDRIPVLMFEGRGGSLLRSDGGLLALALQAATVPGEESLIRVERKSYFEMERLDAHALQRYKAVVLVNIPSFSQYFQFTIERFVEKGGGLMVVLGDRILPAEYARLHGAGRGLLPCAVLEPLPAQRAVSNPTFPAGQAQAVLDIFDLSRTRVLNEVKIKQRWDIKPAADAQALGFVDGQPFLAVRGFGEGRVALWATSMDLGWSNFPITQDFLPLVQNLVIHLSANVQPPINLRQREALLYAVPQKDIKEGEKCRLKTPRGQVQELPLRYEAGSWVAEWPNTVDPGLYSAEVAGQTPKHYAVQLPEGEGDLSELEGPEKEKAEAYAGAGFAADLSGLRQLMQHERGEREAWKFLLLACLLLLACESWVSWRFSS